MAFSVWDTPIIDARKTAGIIQKYKAEKAILCASTLINVVGLAPAEAAAVLPKAMPLEPT